MLAIGSALRARGHAVCVLTHCAYSQLVRGAGLSFLSLDHQEEFDRFIEDLPLLQSPPGSATFAVRHLLRNASPECDILMEKCKHAESIIVERHMSSFSSRVVAEKLGIPLITVFTTISQVNTLALLSELCENTLAIHINRFRSEFGLTPVLDWRAWLQCSRAIGAWPPWFASLRATQHSDVEVVGFLTHDDSEAGDIPAPLQELLRSNLVVLITGGTGRWVPDAKFYEVCASACHLAGYVGVLVTRHHQLVPEPLPPRIMWFDSLPFASAIPRFSLVIHHGGAGTIARTTISGIPQLVLACGGDRPDNGEQLEQLGIGARVLLSDWCPEIVAHLIRTLSESNEIRENCKLIAKRAREVDPATLASKIVEESL